MTAYVGPARTFTDDEMTNAVAMLSGNMGVQKMAKGGSAKDITEAVEYIKANGGIGTINIPSGVFDFWDNSNAGQTVIVPIGINIVGAPPTGSDALGIPTQWNTKIRQGVFVPGNESGGMDGNPYPTSWFALGVSYSGEYFHWNVPNQTANIGNYDPTRWTKPIRFANIYLEGWRTSHPEVGSYVTLTPDAPNNPGETIGLSVTGVIHFRIDHCNLENLCAGAIGFGGLYYSNLYCCGVIDHNKIYNTLGIDNNANYRYGNVGYGVVVGRMNYPDCPIYDPTVDLLGKYHSYSVYIENNYFSKWRHDIASGHGSWYIARYNLFEHDFIDCVVTDMHGERDYAETDPAKGMVAAGSRGGEIYENTFRLVDYYGENYNGSGVVNMSAFVARGGGGVFFNNSIDNTYSPWATVIVSEYDYVFNEIWKMRDFNFWGPKGDLVPNHTTAGANFDPFVIPPAPYDVENNNHWEMTRLAGNPSDPSYPNANPAWGIGNYKPYTYPHPFVSGMVQSTTPKSTTMPAGVYIVKVPLQITIGGKTYTFDHWAES